MRDTHCLWRIREGGWVLRLGLCVAMGVAGSSAAAQFVGPAPMAMQPGVSLGVPALPESTGTTVLLAGDLIEVQIFGLPSFDYKMRVADDGVVTLPLAGSLPLGELTISSAERAIAARLVTSELLKNPQVNLRVLESSAHAATVTGEVKAPGPIPIYGERRLLDVLSAAGGLTPLASPVITIFRRGVTDPLQVRIPSDAGTSGRANILIAPGDNLVVSKVGMVYVLGAFHAQGAVALKTTTPLTLLEAMSMAGGINYEAAMGSGCILRATADGRREIPFKVKDVLHRHIPDLTVQNDDIVFVPTNDLKAAVKGGAAGVAASLLAGIGYLTIAR